MNFDLAIDIQRSALQRLLTVMFAALGIGEGEAVAVTRERVRLMVLRVLGPAESAVRRLIFLKARDMATPNYVRGPSLSGAIPRGKGVVKPLPFPLFDPRKKFGKGRASDLSVLGRASFFSMALIRLIRPSRVSRHYRLMIWSAPKACVRG